jgi:hypothetical protein
MLKQVAVGNIALGPLPEAKRPKDAGTGHARNPGHNPAGLAFTRANVVFLPSYR